MSAITKDPTATPYEVTNSPRKYKLVGSSVIVQDIKKGKKNADQSAKLSRHFYIQKGRES